MAAPSAFIGITTPLTGPYSADGKDEQLGYELAIAEINAGSPIARKWGLKGKGVLGKTLHYKVADSQTKPNVAVQAQTGFIQNDKAIMITGSVSSATAIALEELAQRDKVLNMVGLSGSNDTTGKNCQRYGFRSQPSAYMACKALAPVVAKALGKDMKAAYLVPDYTYGHSVFDSLHRVRQAVRLDGGHQAGGAAGHLGLQLRPAEHRQQRRARCSSTSPSAPTRWPRPSRRTSSAC